MEFLNPTAFLLLLIIPFFFFIKSKNLPFSKEVAKKIVVKGKISKKNKFYLFIISFVLFIIALAKPAINNKEITIKAPTQNIIIALDISKKMNNQEFYPNNLEFAKSKIKKLLTFLHFQNVALILFDKNTFLVSPLTQDYESIIYLLNHLNLKNLNRSTNPNIENAISAAKKLAKEPKIVLFTSSNYIPSDKNVFIYHISKNKIYSSNIFNATYSNKNLKQLSLILNSNKNKEIKITDTTMLFYYPLFLGLILFIFTLFFPIRRIKWDF